jgi:hypothetical protein
MLERLASDLINQVDIVWLANRSEIDPRKVSAEDFLEALYGSKKANKESVYIASKNRHSSLEKFKKYTIWPKEPFKNFSKKGIWFLPQPVVERKFDSLEDSISDFRYIVLKNDEAPAFEWLAAIVRIAPRITAITFSGKKMHVIVRLDAPTRTFWDENFLNLKGLEAIGTYICNPFELTRLPGCFYICKNKVVEQKLLYFAPSSPPLTINELCIRRNITL